MNNLVKKSAVNRYSALHAEGKSEDVVKAAISLDDKKFSAEEVEEIYTAIVVQGKSESPNLGDGDPNSGGEQNPGSGDPNPGDTGGDNPNPGTPGDTGNAGGEQNPGTPVRYLVVKEFRDIANFRKEYKAGDEVSHFAAERLAHLVAIGCVEKH